MARLISKNAINHIQCLVSIMLYTVWMYPVSGESMGTAIPLSDRDKRELVSVHNLLRGIVEPPASNMQPMVSTTTNLI